MLMLLLLYGGDDWREGGRPGVGEGTAAGPLALNWLNGLTSGAESGADFGSSNLIRCGLGLDGSSEPFSDLTLDAPLELLLLPGAGRF